MDQCERCQHKKQPDGGWCYMFKDKPRHVPTYWCAKYEPIDPEEKEYLEDMFAIQKRLSICYHCRIKASCWPRGFFKMRDDPDPHGHTWLILPDGQMVDVSHHNDPSVNPAQVAWMVEVLNQALEREDVPKNTTEAFEHHLRDVLACWCAGIPMNERREIRDNAIAFFANMKNGMNPPNVKDDGAGASPAPVHRLVGPRQGQP